MSLFTRGRQYLRRKFGLHSSETDESDGKKTPKPPRRPDRSKRDASDPTHIKRMVVVMGAPRTGKTAIINQFLYNTFTPRYKRTIEEMHLAEYEVGGVRLTLQILDTCGENEFPAMRNLSITNADAFILVYDLSDPSTFDTVQDLRDQILEKKGTETVPIVVVANKSDIADESTEGIWLNATESVVTVDWEHGFVEASARENTNIAEIFKEVLHQAKVKYDLSPALRKKHRRSPRPADGAGTSRARATGSASPASQRTGSSSSSRSRRQHPHHEKQSGTARSSCTVS